MSLQVVPYEPALRDSWDELVRRARAPHFLFERAYMDYHAERFADASVLVLHKTRPIAALPANRAGDELVSHGGLTFGGLLLDPATTVARTVEALGAVLDHARTRGVRTLVYRPMPHIYHALPAQDDLYALTVHGARLVHREVTSAIPRGGRARYSQERRRAVRRGLRAGARIARSTDYAAFMAMTGAMLRRRHGLEPVHTAAEIELLAERFPDAIALHAAYAGDELVAGVLIYETPMVAHAQYIASSERGRELGAGDALMDHLLNTTYREKPWFDLGVSNERDGSLNAGLVRNKEGFGARTVVHDHYVIEVR